MAKERIKKLGLLFLTIFGVMGVGYFLLVLVYLIPDKMIYSNVGDSADILMKEGVYPTGFLNGWFLDNWTDADCISDTYNVSSSNPFYNALNAFQVVGENNSASGSIEALQSAVYGDASRKEDHTRLWHGYRIWLRPLLVKYNISNIRGFCFGTIIFLMVVLCIILVLKKNNVYAFVPFLIAFTVFNFQMESLSLLFFNDLAITLLGSILIAYMSNKEILEGYYEEVFAGIGAVVAFTSMIIMPMLTIGFMAVIWLMLNEGKSTWKKNTKGIIKYSVCWGVGYIITIFSKIAISTVVFKSDTGMRLLALYTGNDAKHTVVQRWERVLSTFSYMLRTRSELEKDMLVIFIGFLTVRLIVKKRKCVKKIYEYIPYAIIALYPCVWCFVCSTHAGHGWTYFNYSISIFAFLAILQSMNDFERKRKG